MQTIAFSQVFLVSLESLKWTIPQGMIDGDKSHYDFIGTVIKSGTVAINCNHSNIHLWASWSLDSVVNYNCLKSSNRQPDSSIRRSSRRWVQISLAQTFHIESKNLNLYEHQICKYAFIWEKAITCLVLNEKWHAYVDVEHNGFLNRM